MLEPLVVCGPSGVGKGTIISKYMADYNGSEYFGFTVSHTTRQAREGEVDGVHYHFTSPGKMREDIQSRKFLEHAEVHGNIYGTSFSSMRHVQDVLGKKCLLDIDVQGVKSIKRQQQEGEVPIAPKFIFISPPSMEILRERLSNRGTETKETLERRTKNSAAEMEYGLAKGNFDYIVVNDDLEKACHEFDTAVKKLYMDLA